jgi:serine/threonine protein kinase
VFKKEEEIETEEYIYPDLLYMAPEQITDSKSVPASDLWHLGVLMYTMFCGISPFGLETLDP